MRKENLVLIGFMGSGKTETGRLLAGQLGLEFIDTDVLIEARAGKPIREIFRDEGEEAFRALERKIIGEVASRKGQVIATGGGVPVNPDNVAALGKTGYLVWLKACPEKIWERVCDNHDRPLLAVPNPLQRIRELLSSREPFYAQADFIVDTSYRTVESVAEEIIKMWNHLPGGGV